MYYKKYKNEEFGFFGVTKYKILADIGEKNLSFLEKNTIFNTKKAVYFYGGIESISLNNSKNKCYV